MKRTHCPRKTVAFAMILHCLGMLVGLSCVSDVRAGEWIYFAPDHVVLSPSDQPLSDHPLFVTDAMFAEMMAAGAGATGVAGNVSGVSGGRASVPTRSLGLGGRSEFFFDPSGLSSRERGFFPIVPAHHPVESAVRAGWWGLMTAGSLNKVGEYQDLRSAAFWDVEQLQSDGVHTLELFGTGLDNESTQSGLYLFSPKYSANIRYQRLLHRLDHDPLTNMPAPASGAEIVSEDLNVGEDFAVRVQDFKTSFRGTLSKDIKYRLNLWLRRKKGERQALGTHHGAPGVTDCRVCHVVNQRQTIDWATARIEPIIEAQIGPVKAQYSRPMRSFSQNDGVVLRSYGGFHGYDYAGDFPYAVVPDTVSQTDRLRLSFNLPAETSVYTQLHRGDTRNKLRDTRRDYSGIDFRLTNSYSSKLKLNAFARFNRQQSHLPPFLVPPEGDAISVPTAIVPPYGLRHPVDYLKTSAGVDARWRPFRKSGVARGLAFNVGGEYGLIKRSYADYVVLNSPAVIEQDETPYTSYFAGTTMKWHPRFDTFVRYKGRVVSRPLFGVDLDSGVTNTNLPEHQDVVQFGGTWVAANNLIANASIGIENRKHRSEIADFEEDNYPITFTLWYAPNRVWSISGGYGYYSNWIDQDILFPSDDPATDPLDRRKWNYGGQGQVVNFASNYQWSKSVTLTGSLQYVWAFNAFDPLEPWPDLPAYSEVNVNTTRYSGGVDWYANERISAYMRYIYEDYDDGSTAYLSGSAHMLLGGFTAFF